MKKAWAGSGGGIRSAAFLALAVFSLSGPGSAQALAPAVMAYYVGWEQSQMPPSDIDFTAITALIDFSVVPNANGSLNQTVNGLTPANISAAVSAAHAAGKRILFTVGGAGSQSAFESAMSSTYQASFISNLVGFLRSNGYDGIDIDMEPTSAGDQALFVQFAANLRTALNALSPRPMLTTTAEGTPALFAAAASQFDQINIMSYCLSGAWPGWFTWHDSAVYSTGYTFTGGGAPPSADTLVGQFLAAGIPRNLLGIGFTMDPTIWSGVSVPGQTWSAATPPTVAEAAYNAVAAAYGIVEYDYSNPDYHWDSNAQAPYLSITNQTPNLFISYDNEVSAQAKAQYIKRNGLGSLIVWDLQDGHRASQPAGRQDILLEAIKQAFFGGSTPPTIAITAPANNSAVSGFITVSGTAADNVAVSSVAVSVDGGPYSLAVGTATWTFSLNSTALAGTVHSITGKAWDPSGNISTVTVSVTVETMPPLAISALGNPGIGSNFAIVAWTTDIAGTSQVQYGTSTAYGELSALDTALVTTHDVAITGLAPATTYHFSALSRTAGGSLAVSGDSTLTTSAVGPFSGPPPASQVKAPQRFLSPSLADGINDAATFGPGASEVSIYNLQGQQVFHGTQQGGIPITWNCKNSLGRVIDSGVYIARIRSSDSGTIYQSFAIVK